MVEQFVSLLNQVFHIFCFKNTHFKRQGIWINCSSLEMNVKSNFHIFTQYYKYVPFNSEPSSIKWHFIVFVEMTFTNLYFKTDIYILFNHLNGPEWFYFTTQI